MLKQNKLYISPGEIIDSPKRLKATRPQTQLRIAEVINWLRKGYSKKKCIDLIMENYDITEGQAKHYLHDAYATIYDASKVADPEELKEQYVDRIEDLLSSMLEKGNTTLAIRLQDMLNRIAGVYNDKQQVEIKSDVIKFKFDE